MKRFIALCIVLLTVPLAYAGVTLQWSASQTAGVTEYAVYSTTTPGQYGATPIAIVNGLTYAHDSGAFGMCYTVRAQMQGAEADPSNEVCITKPSPARNLYWRWFR